MNARRAAAVECFGRQAAAYVALHAGRSTTRYVENVDVEIATIEAGGLHVPVTITGERRSDAWVVSPITTYGAYAAEESQRLLPPFMRPIVRVSIDLVERWMRRAALHRAVTINNWLLSTNLYPPVAAIDVERMTIEGCERWPGHALWFRSLNRMQHADWLAALVDAGFALIPTRQVYLFLDPHPPHRPNLRRDLDHLRRTSLARATNEAFLDTDYPRIAALYARLYLEKYSRLNPQYTDEFFAAWHRAGLLELTGFRNAGGTLLAVVGTFTQGRVRTAPIVGYDTSLPQALGLYRLLMAEVIAGSIEHGDDLNLSAGAAGFKRHRGGVGAIEYSAVFTRHLDRSTRRAVAVLSRLTTGIGVPVMQRYEL